VFGETFLNAPDGYAKMDQGLGHGDWCSVFWAVAASSAGYVVGHRCEDTEVIEVGVLKGLKGPEAVWCRLKRNRQDARSGAWLGGTV